MTQLRAVACSREGDAGERPENADFRNTRNEIIAASMRRPKRTYLLEARVDGPPRGKRLLIWLPACPDYKPDIGARMNYPNTRRVLPDEMPSSPGTPH